MPSPISFSEPAKDIRTNWLPRRVSKSIPGAVATPVSSSSRWHQDVGVVGEVADVGVDVERAVGGCEPADAHPGQADEELLPVRGVAGHVTVELGVGLGGEGRGAACWVSAGGQMVKLPVSTSTGRRRSSGTSIQPSRQPVIEKYLLKEPNTIAEREVCPGGAATAVRAEVAVVDPVVDLVADQPHSACLAPFRDGIELVGQQHRPGRVGRGGDHQPGDRAGQCVQLEHRRLEPRLGATVDLDDLAAEGPQDVAIAGVTGSGHHHPVAHLEGARNASRNPPEEPVVTTTSSRVTSMPLARRWWEAMASRRVGSPVATV